MQERTADVRQMMRHFRQLAGYLLPYHAQVTRVCSLNEMRHVHR